MITHDFFVVPKLEVILYNMVFVFLDIVLIKETLLDLGKVPCDDELASRCNDRILLLTFTGIKPNKRRYDSLISE